jgi:hypothetical protein
MTTMDFNKLRGVPQPIQRDLTVSSVGTIYGCTGVFDLCGDADLVSLSLQSPDPLLDYIGWEVTDVCVLERNYIDRIIPDEEVRAGWLGDACADPNTVNWSTVAFRIEDFARLRRATPTQDVTKNALRLCESQPRYRKDGTPITDDREFRAVMAAEVMLQDLKLMLVNGDADTAGQFDGLEKLITTGYTDFKGRRASAMDSIVIDWNGNTLAGGAGATWTDSRGSRNITSTATFTDVLRSIVRILKARIKNSGLGVLNLQLGDMVLVATSEMAESILDQYTCWSVCEGGEFNEANINTLEARAFREGLMGGTFSANGTTIQAEGIIRIHGVAIPIITYDWGLQQGSSASDIYLLTGSVGGRKVMNGEFNDFRSIPTRYENAFKFFTTDGGKVLGYFETDQTCVNQVSEMQPRLVMPAPWLQVRIADVTTSTPGGPFEADVLSSFFYGGTSFELA